ncbi:hypothetical protein GCM10027059_26790 [Myceligenerans halotolerans]
MTGPRNVAHLDARIYRPVSIEWREDARCLDEDPELFFFVDEERGEPKRRHIAEARAVCRECPVAMQCLADALATKERNGIRALFDFSNPAEREQAERFLAGATEGAA